MSAAITLNGDQVYADELVRENARLTVQHAADQQRILVLSDLVEQLEQENETLSDQAGQAAEDLSMAQAGLEREKVLASQLDRAIKDLHFVMADGDACTVCKNKCPMGAADACKPRWRGLDG